MRRWTHALYHPSFSSLSLPSHSRLGFSYQKSWFRNSLQQADVLCSLGVLRKKKKMVAELLWKKNPSHTVGVLIALENEI